MNKGLLFAAMLAIVGASPAMAWDCTKDCADGSGSSVQHQRQNQIQTQGQGQSTVVDTNAVATGNGNGSNETNIESSSYTPAPKIPVSTAYAPSLTAGADTCLGSITGGAQTSFLGLSVGGTKRDANCEHIKNTHLIMEFNREAGCDYMLKNVPGAQDAFDQAGANCKNVVVVVVPNAEPVAPIVTTATLVTPLATVPPVILKSPTE